MEILPKEEYKEKLSTRDEEIANAMLKTKGNLALVSRLPEISMNAMELKNYVGLNQNIRARYHELLTEELQEQGLHIAERILEMAKMQQDAYGNEGKGILPDPKMAIELSKEISRLISESKSTNISNKSAMLITSKESAVEILQEFLKT